MPVFQKWTPLDDYEGHELNMKGQIRNVKTGNILKTSVNQTGVRYVSIRNTSLGKYENKAVSVLVANTFGATQLDRDADTALHRDGDLDNVSSENIMYTRRWHAIAYHKEIADPRWAAPKRISDTKGNRYSSITAAAMATGALPSAIEYAIRYNSSLAVDEHTNFVHRVEPGGHIFKA